MEIRLPNITSPTTEGKLSQMQTYLYQLTNQLNLALKATESEIQKVSTTINATPSPSKSEADKALDTFNEVKNLIIKSADIVTAYYETIESKLVGEYTALSDYGSFKETTEAFISQTTTDLTQHYSSIQEIESDLENINELRKDSCYIKTGWLDNGKTIAGVEIGKQSEKETGVVDTAFARFTTDELAFYNEGGVKLAWFAKNELNITNAVIRNNLYVGGYQCDTSNGIAFRWVGRRA
jgi:hypothetical protein